MSPTPPQSANLRDDLLREAVEMIRYAFASGKSVPTSVVDTVEQYTSQPADAPLLDASGLVLVHSRLAKIVAPATPRAIVILADGDANSRFAFLGPVPLVRQLMGVAIFCVLAFVLIGLTEVTGASTVTIANNSGWLLLLNQTWWLAAAGVGASFANLFRVNEYIERSNYNPRYASTYWVKFLLGVMAGYILVALLPVDLRGDGAGLHLMQPAVAMLGGYSASAVYRILTRLIEAIEAIFRGNAREVIAEREQAAAARASEEAANVRVRLAARLVDVLRQLPAGAGNDEVSASIRDIVASLTPEAAEAEHHSGPLAQAQITVAATPQALMLAAGMASEEPAAAG
jgi:hypothetical protein